MSSIAIVSTGVAAGVAPIYLGASIAHSMDGAGELRYEIVVGKSGAGKLCVS